jgi:hypothetical protein
VSVKLFNTLAQINVYPSVNLIISPADVHPAALALATDIIANSVDSVQSTKKGLLLSQRHSNEEMVAVHVRSPETLGNFQGVNIKVRPF